MLLTATPTPHVEARRPEGCFFCEQTHEQLEHAGGVYRGLLLAGPAQVRAAERARAHLQRLVRALDRHRCDSPRRAAPASPARPA